MQERHSEEVWSQETSPKKSMHFSYRSQRQRRRAYEKEQRKLVSGFHAAHPRIPLPTDPEQRAALRRSEPLFDDLCRQLDALVEHWWCP